MRSCSFRCTLQFFALSRQSVSPSASLSSSVRLSLRSPRESNDRAPIGGTSASPLATTIGQASPLPPFSQFTPSDPFDPLSHIREPHTLAAPYQRFRLRPGCSLQTSVAPGGGAWARKDRREIYQSSSVHYFRVLPNILTSKNSPESVGYLRRLVVVEGVQEGISHLWASPN